MRIEIRKSMGLFCIVILTLFIGAAINVISSKAFAQPQFLEEMVPMRDGIRLHTFVYLPDSKVWAPPYPAIIQRTAYGIGKAGVLPGPNQPPPILRGWKAGIERGYAIVFQVTRGRFASEGIFRIFYDEAQDGYDTVEWAARQPWCNGNIGVAGSSAPGISTYAAAFQKPPALKAIFVQGASSDFYNDIFYEGQSFELEFRLLSTVTPVDLSASHVQSLKYQKKNLKKRVIQIRLLVTI